jgi:hypothetical protein
LTFRHCSTHFQVEKEAKEPLAKEKEDEVGGDKGSEKGAKKRKTPVPVEEEEQEEARVRPHERISIEVPSQTMKSAIAIPPMSEVSKLMQLANLRQRAVLSSTALPSIAFYTFLNSHKAVNSVALDAEGAHAAACMADSTVFMLSIWCLHFLGCSLLSTLCSLPSYLRYLLYALA